MEKAHLDLEQMLDSARVDRFGDHEIVDDPAGADLILFVETSWAAGHYFEKVRRHPVYREHRSKSFLFSAMDRVVPFLPGVYASIERRWYSASWVRSGYYPGVREVGNLAFEASTTPSLLFSFVGSIAAHPVRGRLLEMQCEEARVLDSDASRLEPSAYAEAVRDSAFVLCPRGGGPSTFRLFEAMMLGRAPVIVSDRWVPPLGPDWNSLSIRVPEREVGAIPDLLRSRRARAAEMGEAARAAWLDWFSPEAGFHRTVEWCLELDRAGARSGQWRRLAPRVQMLRPYHAARKLAKGLGHGASEHP